MEVIKNFGDIKYKEGRSIYAIATRAISIDRFIDKIELTTPRGFPVSIIDTSVRNEVDVDENEFIQWDKKMMSLSSAMYFNFCYEFQHPFLLMRLGQWINTRKKLFIVIDEGYVFKDILKKLIDNYRPGEKIIHDQDEVVASIWQWLQDELVENVEVVSDISAKARISKI